VASLSEDILKTPASSKPPQDKLYASLQYLGLVLLLMGFSGPWYYGALGKSADFGWQPVWGFLEGILYINVFIIVAVLNCLSYTELLWRRGRPVLEAILKWVGAFLVLVIVVPLVAWSLFDQTGRTAQPVQSVDSLGWGLWTALAGLLIQLTALRLRIRALQRYQPTS
jgi:hypothetical protein